MSTALQELIAQAQALRSANKKDPHEAQPLGEFAHSVVTVVEPLSALPELLELLSELRNLLEDIRIASHVRTSSQSVDVDLGWTEDAAWYFALCIAQFLYDLKIKLCFLRSFLAVICCDGVRRKLGFCLNTCENFVGVGSGYASYPRTVVDKPVCEFTEQELQTSYASFFVHSKQVDWRDTDTHKYISALQWRTEELLYAKMQKGEDAALCDMGISRWSCSTARAKLMAIQCAEYTREDVDSNAFEAWAIRIAPTWEGTRLRAAMANAMRKRDLRLDEAGEVCALSTNATLRRAKGAMQAIEEVVSTINIHTVLALPNDQCYGPLERLKQIIQLKLFANVLETMDCAFMTTYLHLDSCYEQWKLQHLPWDQAAEHIVIETAAGWHNATRHKEISPARSMSAALQIWYKLHYKEQDPLGMFVSV